jgi:hypothetical protein
MPPLTQAVPEPDPDHDTQPPSRVSRRSLLRGAAGAGAVGLAVAGGAVAIAGPTAAAGLPQPDHQGAVTVYLRDAATGEMDVFAGTSQVRVRDRALAAQLLRAIK